MTCSEKGNYEAFTHSCDASIGEKQRNTHTYLGRHPEVVRETI